MDENRELRRGQHYEYRVKNRRVANAAVLLLSVAFPGFVILIFHLLNNGGLMAFFACFLLVVVLVFCLLWGVYYIMYAMVYRRCTGRAEGFRTSRSVKVSIPDMVRAEGHPMSRTRANAPIIVFQVDGREYHCTDPVARTGVSWKGGTNVCVRYDPQNPKTNYLEKAGKPKLFWYFLLPTVAFFIVSALFFGIFLLAV